MPREDFRGTESARRRNRAHHRAGSRHAAQDVEPHPARPADRQFRELREAGEGLLIRGEGRQLGRGARSDGRRGRDHAVELSAAPDHAQGGAGARRRLHRGVEALRDRALQRLHPRRGDRVGRPAEGRVQPRDRVRPRDRRGAGEASRRGRRLLHGLDARREAHLRAGFAISQKGRARARRQERLGDPRRRRPRGRGEGHGGRLLPELGADLHRPHMLVPDSLYEQAKTMAAEVARGFTVGDPMAETTKLGPLSSQAQLERVRSYFKKGQQEGAELVAGGADAPEGVPAGGYYVKPTVFGKVKNSMTIAQEEIFGPVLSIIPYKDEEDAVRIANDTV